MLMYMDAPKKRGRKKKAEVSKKTEQRRQQRARTNMSQNQSVKQSVKQSVVVNVGDTKSKRKSTSRKRSGGMPPSTYQHNLAPTFIQSPDYTPLILALNRTPNAIQPPMPTISERTPLSVGVQTAEQELASSSTFEPVALEMNRRPRNSFVSNSHLDRRVEAQVQEPRAEVDYGFGNQQFFPKPRSESVVSELSESSDSGFSVPSNVSQLRQTTNLMRGFDTPTLPSTPLESQSLQTYERSVSFADRPQERQRSISGSTMSIPLSAQPPLLENQLPVQEQPHSAQGSLQRAEQGSPQSSRRSSSVSTQSSSSGLVLDVEQGSVASSKKVRLGRPLVQSGSSVGSREQPDFAKYPIRSTAIYKALNATFDNYDKQGRLKDLKPSEVGRILGNISNKRRVDKLYKAKVISYDDLTGYYERQGIISQPPKKLPTT